MHFELGTNELCTLTHELKSEVPAAAGCDRSDVEPSTVGAHGQEPVARVARARYRGGGCRAVLPYILQRFLQDAQDHRLLGGGQAVGRSLELRGDREARDGRESTDGVRDRPVQAELVQDWRAELADERPH